MLNYHFNDGGRGQSKRPKQINDCTVRALSIIIKDMSYDDIYDFLASKGRKCSSGFALPKYLNKQLWAKKISFQAIKGQPRMNPNTFSQEYPKGIFIIRTAKHVAVVIDGVLHDTFNMRQDRCIYTAWEIINTPLLE